MKIKKDKALRKGKKIPKRVKAMSNATPVVKQSRLAAKVATGVRGPKPLGVQPKQLRKGPLQSNRWKGMPPLRRRDVEGAISLPEKNTLIVLFEKSQRRE
jgi:hypothetical protein